MPLTVTFSTGCVSVPFIVMISFKEDLSNEAVFILHFLGGYKYRMPLLLS
jgi:hypothetical protein